MMSCLHNIFVHWLYSMKLLQSSYILLVLFELRALTRINPSPFYHEFGRPFGKKVQWLESRDTVDQPRVEWWQILWPCSWDKVGPLQEEVWEEQRGNFTRQPQWNLSISQQQWQQKLLGSWILMCHTPIENSSARYMLYRSSVQTEWKRHKVNYMNL